jgi:quinoprotein glucose dehydrogenase
MPNKRLKNSTITFYMLIKELELTSRGKKGSEVLIKAINQTDNQLARIHGIWGIGQLSRFDKAFSTTLIPLLKDKDEEIAVQAIKMLGDADIISVANDLIPFLSNPNYRLRFYAAEALGQLKFEAAVEPLIGMLKGNNDEDLYIRHAAVMALSRIGKAEPLIALANNPSKALRTAAVLVLRKLKNEKIALFLKDNDEYIVTEAARAINDDLSIPAALPALAAVLNETRFTDEALIRRAINAALRVGGEKELSLLTAFSTRTDIKDEIKAEALATLGTWASPSVLDRVDGRVRGKIERDPSIVKAKVQPLIPNFLKETNTETLTAIAGLLTNLGIKDFNAQLAKIYDETKESKVKTAFLTALNKLNYSDIETLIKNGMEDKDGAVRVVALGLLNNGNVSKESLPAIVKAVFTKGSTNEQQQLLAVMAKLDGGKTETILSDLLSQMQDKKLSPNLNLELKEAVLASGSAALKAQLAALKPDNSLTSDYAEALYGGNRGEGRNIVMYNAAAQCMRCHAIGTEGGNVGPALTNIGNSLTREQLLQSLVEPSARIAPGYGNVSLKLKGGQDVYGVLAKETDDALTITTSDAEPLVIPVSRIVKRENLPSGMPAMGDVLSKREIRDIVEFLTSLKKRE